MKPIKYFGIGACIQFGFPYIYKELTAAEQAPDYESEATGIAELEKVLEFVKNDTYYPTFEEKSAYLMCSIAGSQYFSNGNKRLSVTVLLMFLMHNEAAVLNDELVLKNILMDEFSKHVWEKVASIRDPHSLFLYNLAIVLGDRAKWDVDDFTAIRLRVAGMFKAIHARV